MLYICHLCTICVCGSSQRPASELFPPVVQREVSSCKCARMIEECPCQTSVRCKAIGKVCVKEFLELWLAQVSNSWCRNNVEVMMVQQRFRPILHHLIMLLSCSNLLTWLLYVAYPNILQLTDKYIYLYLSYASSLSMSWLEKQVGGLFWILVDVSRHKLIETQVFFRIWWEPCWQYSILSNFTGCKCLYFSPNVFGSNSYLLFAYSLCAPFQEPYTASVQLKC